MSDDKITMAELLAVFDSDEKALWDQLSENQQKSASKDFFILTRWMSMVDTGKRDIVEHFVLATNEYYNKHWPVLYKNKQLMWQLLCMCSYDTKSIFKHAWSFPKKRATGSKGILQFLEEKNPSAKISDLEVLASLMTKAEAIELAMDYGIDKNKAKDMF